MQPNTSFIKKYTGSDLRVNGIAGLYPVAGRSRRNGGRLERSVKKSYMAENGLEILTGSEHKAIYKTVTSSRIDTTALKKALPEVAERYTKTSETKRFTFA